jgi:S1-C subfamily serine protease
VGIHHPRLAAAYSLPVEFGAYVEALEPGSPADRGGLRPGDIITHFDDQAIDEENNMLTVLMRFDPGEQVQVTVVRKGAEVILDVTLGTR